MRFTVKLEKQPQKELDKIPQEYKKRIFVILETLGNNPYLGKKLEGELKGLYSCRVWPYRIVYRIYKNALLVIVLKIAHRQGVYK